MDIHVILLIVYHLRDTAVTDMMLICLRMGWETLCLRTSSLDFIPVCTLSTPTEQSYQNNSGDQKLVTALCIASQKYGGCGLVCSGSSKGAKNKKRIYCPKFCHYDSLKNAKTASKEGKPEPLGPVQLNTYHCDRNNTRGNLGKSMKKRMVTILPMPGEVTCKVRMILEHDHQTFFLRCGVGRGIHVNHTRMDADEMTMQSRFIDETMLTTRRSWQLPTLKLARQQQLLTLGLEYV